MASVNLRTMVAIAGWILSGPLAVAIAFGIYHRTAGPLLIVFLAMFWGPVIGLTADAPYFTAPFKVMLAAGLTTSFGVLLAGIKYFARPWGKALLPLGAIGWALCGALGFGPQ